MRFRRVIGVFLMAGTASAGLPRVPLTPRDPGWCQVVSQIATTARREMSGACCNEIFAARVQQRSGRDVRFWDDADGGICLTHPPRSPKEFGLDIVLERVGDRLAYDVSYQPLDHKLLVITCVPNSNGFVRAGDGGWEVVSWSHSRPAIDAGIDELRSIDFDGGDDSAGRQLFDETSPYFDAFLAMKLDGDGKALQFAHFDLKEASRDLNARLRAVCRSRSTRWCFAAAIRSGAVAEHVAITMATATVPAVVVRLGDDAVEGYRYVLADEAAKTVSEALRFAQWAASICPVVDGGHAEECANATGIPARLEAELKRLKPR